MTSEELVNELEIAVPEETASIPGADPEEVYTGLFASFLIASQQQHAEMSHTDRMFIEDRKARPMREGMIRTAGLSEDEFDMLSLDPVAMNRMRADYISTI